MQLILRIVSTLVTAYSFVLIFRVLASLFFAYREGRAWRLLSAVTDPVLRPFRVLRFLRTASVDFTPLAAVVALQIVASLLWSLSDAAIFTGFTLVAALLLAIWRILFWIIGFFALVAAIRFLSLLWSRRPTAFFYQILDNILAPPVRFVSRFFPDRRNADYRVVLGVLAFFLIFLCIVGFFVIDPLLRLIGYRSGLAI